MYQYFPNNHTWSLAVMSALNPGGQIAEVDEACRGLHEAASKKALDGDKLAQNAWFESWCKMAERVERLAQADEAAGHPLSAGRKYLRVGLYFQLAERMPSHKDPRRLVAYKKGITAFERGLALRKEPVEYVRVPYGDTTLPAIFMKAPGSEPTPCMVHFNGLDLTKEIVYAAIADEFRRRGVSLLIVDHPGVGAALRLQGLASGHDTEKPAGACVDYLETRREIDPRRVGIIALSLGGYYAPRAAAFEKRFACCVAWGAIFDYGQAVESRLGGSGEPSVPGYAEHLNWVFGQEKLADTMGIVKQMTLEHIAERITCPLLVVHGENDRQIPLWHAEKTIAAAVNSKDRELKVFSLFDGGSEHCGADNSTMVVDYMTDWVSTVVAEWVRYEYDLYTSPEGEHYLLLMLKLANEAEIDVSIQRRLNCSEPVVLRGFERIAPMTTKLSRLQAFASASSALHSGIKDFGIAVDEGAANAKHDAIAFSTRFISAGLAACLG